MSTPCTRSRSKSGHRDSETWTKVARWAPCVRSCLPSFWHCYTCSRLPTEVRPLILSALRLISQCSIILHVFEYLKAVQKVFKSCIIEYSARIWSLVEKLQASQSVCWSKGSLTEKLIHTCEAGVCSAGVYNKPTVWRPLLLALPLRALCVHWAVWQRLAQIRGPEIKSHFQRCGSAALRTDVPAFPLWDL